MVNGTLSSVRNALRMLKEFTPEEPLLGVSELSRRLDVAKSTTHRLLATLQAEGFVQQAPDGRYGLGFALWELGSRLVSGLELREVAHPVLEALRNETNETVHLAILDGAEVVYIDRFESQATLRLFRRVGYRMPAHSTSTGKVILAFSPPEALGTVMEAGMKALTPDTLKSRRALEAALAEIRARGYAVSTGESEVGLTSVGAPIFDHHGDVAGALSCAGPSARFEPDRLESIIAAVAGAAAKISRGIGHLG
ncbi:MAG: IclR family transcriptional regulator [Myxococcota bacterium]